MLGRPTSRCNGPGPACSRRPLSVRVGQTSEVDVHRQREAERREDSVRTIPPWGAMALAVMLCPAVIPHATLRARLDAWPEPSLRAAIRGGAA